MRKQAQDQQTEISVRAFLERERGRERRERGKRGERERLRKIEKQKR